MEYEYKIKKTSICSEKEILSFFELTKKAKQVNKIGLLDRIKKSEILGFSYHKGLLIGISAIKIPSENYKNKIFNNAKIHKVGQDFKYELGYSYTEEKYRGRQISYKLNLQLVSAMEEENIYATTGNPGMKRILEKIGFLKIGKSYRGDYNEDIEILGLERNKAF